MNPLYSWKAKEFEKYEKSTAWFVVMGLVFLALILTAIAWQSYTAFILFVLIGFVVFIYAVREPKTLEYAITHQGVKVENLIYKFDDIESFWIFYDPPEVKYLSLKTKHGLGKHVHIPLGQEDPEKIREVLSRFVPEKKQEEHLADVLARALRF